MGKKIEKEIERWKGREKEWERDRKREGEKKEIWKLWNDLKVLTIGEKKGAIEKRERTDVHTSWWSETSKLSFFDLDKDHNMKYYKNLWQEKVTEYITTQKWTTYGDTAYFKKLAYINLKIGNVYSKRGFAKK